MATNNLKTAAGLMELFREAQLNCRIYSGRSMYKDYCPAITIDTNGENGGPRTEFQVGLELAAVVAADPKRWGDVDDLQNALRGDKSDSMGRSDIVLYFPRIIFTDEELAAEQQAERENAQDIDSDYGGTYER